MKKPINTEQEIVQITKAFFDGKELQKKTSEGTGGWSDRPLEAPFPHISAMIEYRIKPSIPEGYEEIDYRMPKFGDTLLVPPPVGGVLEVGHDAALINSRQVIVKKKEPEYKVGQVWAQIKDGLVSSKLRITEVADNIIYYIGYDDHNKVTDQGWFNTGSPFSEYYVLEEDV